MTAPVLVIIFTLVVVGVLALLGWAIHATINTPGLGVATVEDDA